MGKTKMNTHKDKGELKTYHRTVCTCYFGRLCHSNHATWEDYEKDRELIDYCKKNFGVMKIHDMTTSSKTNMNTHKDKVGEKKYLMIYRERAFGEERETAKEFTLSGLLTYFKHYSDNCVKIHILISL